MGFFTNLFKSKQKAPVIETSAKQNVEIKNEVMQKNLQNAVELDIDLVEASYFRGCCGECAKYRGRWFSISGKDKRFPKMPVDYGCTCMGIDFSPVIFGLSEPMLSDEIDDIITYSNRPFVDDRNDEELEIFNTDRKRLENEEFYEPYKEHWEAIRKYDHQQYDRLCQELPQLAPKSYSGYMAKAKQLPSGSWRVHIYNGELKKQISFTSNLPGKAGKAEFDTNMTRNMTRKKRPPEGERSYYYNCSSRSPEKIWSSYSTVIFIDFFCGFCGSGLGKPLSPASMMCFG